MPAEVDNLDLLERALQQMSAVIGGIVLEQSGLPTPCAEWDVRELVRHVTGKDLRNFIAATRGVTADWQAPADDLGPNWRAQFDEGSMALLEAWATVDPDAMVTFPGGVEKPLRSRADQQIAEMCVHAWDLVRATGQQLALDDEAAERALAWAREMLRPEARGAGKPFAHEVAVPEDAPVYDRLAGWFGRDPHWTATAAAPRNATLES
jgi:uncharacterized protein (TIGR03086 family)